MVFKAENDQKGFTVAELSVLLVKLTARGYGEYVFTDRELEEPVRYLFVSDIAKKVTLAEAY